MYSQKTSFEDMLIIAESLKLKSIQLANGNRGIIGFDSEGFKFLDMDNTKFAQDICDENEIGELGQFLKIDGGENWEYIGAAYAEYSAQQQAEAISDNYSNNNDVEKKCMQFSANGKTFAIGILLKK